MRKAQRTGKKLLPYLLIAALAWYAYGLGTKRTFRYGFTSGMTKVAAGIPIVGKSIAKTIGKSSYRKGGRKSYRKGSKARKRRYRGSRRRGSRRR